jgi:hypothetical protein
MKGRFVMVSRGIASFVLVATIAASIGVTITAAHTHTDRTLDARLSGYPEVTISISDSGIAAPETVDAGRVAMIQENRGSEPAHMAVVRLPEDVTNAQAEADLAAAGDNLAAAIPEWLFRATFAGNPDRAAPGGEAVALVDLMPGRYLILDPVHPTRRTYAEVVPSDATVASRDNPTADVTVELFEMDFTMPATVPAGRQPWQVTNTGAALHEIAIMPVPDGATKEQVIAAHGAALAGQPLPADLASSWPDVTGADLLNALTVVDGVGASSPGAIVWAQFDLEPGTYAAVCYVPSGETTHLMEGMVKVFTVTADGTPPSTV